AGILTFASPCILPLVPVYLGLLAGTSSQEGGRPVPAAIGFALGLSAVFVALGMVASSAAALLAEYRVVLMIAGGVLIVLFGAKLLGIVRLPVLKIGRASCRERV